MRQQGKTSACSRLHDCHYPDQQALYLLAEDTPVDPPAGWVLIPRALWALAAVAFLSFFIEGAIGRRGTVYCARPYISQRLRRLTGFAVFSLSMNDRLLYRDHLTMKLGATNLLRASGFLVASGLGSHSWVQTISERWLVFFWQVLAAPNMVALISVLRRGDFREESERRSRLPPASAIWGFWLGRRWWMYVRGARLAAALALVVVAGSGYLLCSAHSDGRDRIAAPQFTAYGLKRSSLLTNILERRHGLAVPHVMSDPRL